MEEQVHPCGIGIAAQGEREIGSGGREQQDCGEPPGPDQPYGAKDAHRWVPFRSSASALSKSETSSRMLMMTAFPLTVWGTGMGLQPPGVLTGR